MNDFKKRIRTLATKEKKQLYIDVIFIMVNSNKIMPLEELLHKLKKLNRLNENEIKAIYSLALYIKKAIIFSKNEKELFSFLNLSEYCRNDNGNLVKFVNETARDIKEWNKYMNGEWSFHPAFIFKRLSGYKPYEDYKKKSRKEQQKPEEPKHGKVVNYEDYFKF